MYMGIASINRGKPGMPMQHRVAVYKALIQPQLDYCATVWSSGNKKVLNDASSM